MVRTVRLMRTGTCRRLAPDERAGRFTRSAWERGSVEPPRRSLADRLNSRSPPESPLLLPMGPTLRSSYGSLGLAFTWRIPNDLGCKFANDPMQRRNRAGPRSPASPVRRSSRETPPAAAPHRSARSIWTGTAPAPLEPSDRWDGRVTHSLSVDASMRIFDRGFPPSTAANRSRCARMPLSSMSQVQTFRSDLPPCEHRWISAIQIPRELAWAKNSQLRAARAGGRRRPLASGR